MACPLLEKHECPTSNFLSCLGQLQRDRADLVGRPCSSHPAGSIICEIPCIEILARGLLAYPKDVLAVVTR